MIYSPMCPLNLGMKITDRDLHAGQQGGTTTLLECVLPWMLGDKLYKLEQVRQAERRIDADAARQTAEQPAL